MVCGICTGVRRQRRNFLSDAWLNRVSSNGAGAGEKSLAADFYVGCFPELFIVVEGEEKKAPETKAEADHPVKENVEEVAEVGGIEANGILEVMQDGFGFIRCENYLPGENDVYVAPGMIRKYNLKTGDILTGVELRAQAGVLHAIADRADDAHYPVPLARGPGRRVVPLQVFSRGAAQHY